MGWFHRERRGAWQRDEARCLDAPGGTSPPSIGAGLRRFATNIRRAEIELVRRAHDPNRVEIAAVEDLHADDRAVLRLDVLLDEGDIVRTERE